MVDFAKIKQYFQDRLEKFGTSPQGLDWNSIESQHIRYEQLVKVINENEKYTILDYGSGFGSLYDFLESRGHDFFYYGFDIVPEMIEKGKQLHSEKSNCLFTSDPSDLVPADYVVESGIFNMKQNDGEEDWEKYVLKTLDEMNQLAIKGLVFNFLTKYSDPEYMRPDLYYPDPCFYFDYCKRNYSKNVALLHDYTLYDFTILVRK
jgi:SAM-dependent methyltransferase